MKSYNENVVLKLIHGDIKYLTKYLDDHSNLPSPRLNLELADYFAHLVAKDEKVMFGKLIQMCKHSSEYINFCGISALGTCFYKLDNDQKNITKDILIKAMHHPNWRIKESSAIALQYILESLHDDALIFMDQLRSDEDCLVNRALIAGLAHPPVLNNKKICNYAFMISDISMKLINDYDDLRCKSEDVVVLIKGLSYVISVFTVYDSIQGFQLMEHYLESNHKTLNKIIKSNLKKKRIRKDYLDRIEILEGTIN